MSIIYSYPCTTLYSAPEKITISTGPVIIDKKKGKVLLHVSPDTGKYQFIWGRLDDTLNFRENALKRAQEVIGDNPITLDATEPLIIFWTIEKEGYEENILLVHYLGTIEHEEDIGEADWFSLDEIILLDAENKTSSENIRIASQHFLLN
jgi:hypothetical protein